MCGVCGFVRLANPSRGAAALSAMAASLRHRGPDATGVWLDATHTVGLATTRLAIIDIAGGRQPMVSADSTHVVVFNGEIYNFQLLRDQLQSLGHTFLTRSDTEVVLNAFRQWGSDCLPRLRGMFAFALYDTQNQTLFVARDKTGIKPLYYHHGPAGFLFGSELKAVLTDQEVPRQVNDAALADYFVLGYPLLPATIFKDCQELAPGTWLQVSPGGIKTGRYWNWQRKPQTDGRCDLKDVETVLTDAVGEHLCADVEVGAFLSGGIDSSLLVSIIAKHFNKQVRTFTVRFGDKSYDESRDARMVAQHLSTVHHQIEVGNGKVDFSVVEKVLDQFDQPFGDSSAIPSYLLCREVRKHVKVIIAGDGGDEMFGGYPRFRYAEIARALGRSPRWLFPAAECAWRGLGRVFPTQARQARKLLRAARLPSDGRLLALASYVSAADLSSMLVPEILQYIGSYRPPFHAADDADGSDLLDYTIAAALPGDYLRKVDMMSSAHGLEVRVPFLADQVLDFAAQLPRELKFSWWQNKIALRLLADKHLPSPIARKKKHGFGIPLDSWLGPRGRSELVGLLISPSARIRNYVNRSYLEPVLKSFLTGKWDRTMMSREALFQRVYSLWGLERWLQTWRPAD
jgi:asparagine synthase (glutamine-hydrolysing)